MKYFTIIFSIYMTLLALSPCRDSEDFSTISKRVTADLKSHSADKNTEKETCNPFCTCTCCSTVRTVTNYQPVVIVFQQELKQTFSEPQVPALLEQSISIWQPPQLV